MDELRNRGSLLRNSVNILGIYCIVVGLWEFFTIIFLLLREDFYWRGFAPLLSFSLNFKTPNVVFRWRASILTIHSDTGMAK